MLSALLASTSIYAQSSSSVPSGQTSSDSGLEEIVVTAQKTKSNVQSTPIAVSAFDSVSIENRQIQDVLQVLTNVPNFSGANNVTLPTAVSMFIRGVGSTESIITTDPAVALYLDDVIVARQQVDNLGLFDMQRVEVLRGPQGTLYGRNTSGGAVKLFTNPPVDGYSGLIDVGYGSYNEYRIQAMANTPIVDGLLLNRLTFSTDQRGGFVKDITTGESVNDLGDLALHEALKYMPVDDLEFNLKADYSKTRTHGYLGHDSVGYYTPSSDDLYVVHTGDHPFNVGKTYGINGYIDWTLPNGFVVKSITGFRATSMNNEFDLSDQPIPEYGFAQHAFSRQYSQELNISGTIFDHLDFVSGVYYMSETSAENLVAIFQQFGTVDGVYPPKGSAPPPQGAPFETFENLRDQTQTYAAYTQFVDHITDQLSATFGLRYTVDQKSFDISEAEGNPGVPKYLTPTFDTADVIASGIPNSKNFYQATPHFSVDYQFTPDLLGYLSFTKGYQAGGWYGRASALNQVVTEAPTTVKAYELGVKSEFFDRRVRINADVFYQDESDIPTTYEVAGTNHFGETSLGVKIYGLEADGAAIILPGLQANYSLGLLDSHYDPFTQAVIDAGNIGKHLEFAPYVTAKVGYEYIYPLADGSDLRLANNYAFSGAQFTNPANSPAAKSPSRVLVDASLTWEIADGKYAFTASCKNCFNKQYFTNSIDFGGVPPYPVTVLYQGDPQTWLLSAKAKF
jgi:iron complex outermembrane receptor protein